ncbi:MAG: glycosyltransferase family 2 protein [Clostridium sp.]|uniref:glycosyltransferase family 2 protein n=1 Tax=Clostridium sp. TaxID=1506 RepID=UPI001EB5C9B7|nr:glycosyltransferase family 2 protein [Clostridium sp.]MBS5886399.1 glycosyltransferase family 2 protein [Clostridium sp.]MDU7150002.1 glycosyltransferase family 2 protein [Clostridium sp.]MDU7243046.1 glycosyltransferase family 2 protein [Clostridium sp.]
MNKSVAVIIPCRNEEGYIAKCIESFLKQSYPMELLKIVISDGFSNDNTRNIIKDYMKNNENVIMIDNEGLTAPKGMNKGIKATDTDIIIIFGAHAYADKDFVLENVKALENNDVGCVGGVLKTINSTVKGEAIAQAMMCPFGVGNATFRYAEKECYVDTVAFGAYKREVLDKVGIFDDELVRNQDDELNFRVIKNGYKILLSPKIKSTYYGRASFAKLWKQYYQYGFWKVRVIQKHNRPASIRHLIPMLFTLYLLVGGTISVFSKSIRWIFLSILALYVFLDLLFSMKLSCKSKLKYLGYISVCFPILHLSYGIGFLFGILNFYFFKSNKIIKKNSDLSR